MVAAVTPLLVVLCSTPAHSEDAAGAVVPELASCRGLRIPPPLHPREHSPYPSIDRRWPVDVSKAEIVKDERVARRLSEYFRPVSHEEVRAMLMQYVVVPRQEWDHGFSHVAFSDEGGWVATEKRCFQWIVRPGGLAWIVYPDGTAVYLAAFRPKMREPQ